MYIMLHDILLITFFVTLIYVDINIPFQVLKVYYHVLNS
jgi:hypothetical protein